VYSDVVPPGEIIYRDMKTIEAKQASTKPASREAIEMTIRTIEDRGRHYRNLAATVSIVWIVSLFLGVLLHQWIALSGLILVVPLIGGFLLIDSRRIRRWRTEILKQQLMHGLDLALFRKTISGFRHLPGGTLQSMLSTISSHEKITYLQARIHDVTHDAFDADARKNERRILRVTGLLTLGLVCLAGAAVYQSSVLELCGAGLMALFAFLTRRGLQKPQTSLPKPRSHSLYRTTRFSRS
jgi:hypothetical protein